MGNIIFNVYSLARYLEVPIELNDDNLITDIQLKVHKMLNSKAWIEVTPKGIEICCTDKNIINEESVPICVNYPFFEEELEEAMIEIFSPKNKV